MNYNPSSKEIAQLRERTGYGLMDCKEALSVTEGNQEEAVVYLQLPFKTLNMIPKSMPGLVEKFKRYKQYQ